MKTNKRDGGECHTCKHCGSDFTARRSDAAYCSANCRKQNSRRKEKLARLKQSAVVAVREIQRLMLNDDDLHDFAQSLLADIASSCDVVQSGVKQADNRQEIDDFLAWRKAEYQKTLDE